MHFTVNLIYQLVLKWTLLIDDILNIHACVDRREYCISELFLIAGVIKNDATLSLFR